MALTFKKRNDLDKLLGDLAIIPPEFEFNDSEKIEKKRDKQVKTPDDFLKQFDTKTKESDLKDVK